MLESDAAQLEAAPAMDDPQAPMHEGQSDAIQYDTEEEVPPPAPEEVRNVTEESDAVATSDTVAPTTDPDNKVAASVGEVAASADDVAAAESAPTEDQKPPMQQDAEVTVAESQDSVVEELVVVDEPTQEGSHNARHNDKVETPSVVMQSEKQSTPMVATDRTAEPVTVPEPVTSEIAEPTPELRVAELHASTKPATEVDDAVTETPGGEPAIVLPKVLDPVTIPYEQPTSQAMADLIKPSPTQVHQMPGDVIPTPEPETAEAEQSVIAIANRVPLPTKRVALKIDEPIEPAAEPVQPVAEPGQSPTPKAISVLQSPTKSIVVSHRQRPIATPVAPPKVHRVVTPRDHNGPIPVRKVRLIADEEEIGTPAGKVESQRSKTAVPHKDVPARRVSSGSMGLRPAPVRRIELSELPGRIRR